MADIKRSSVVKGIFVVVAMIAVAIASVLITLAASSKASTQDDGPKYAIAMINIGTSETGINGFVELSQETSTSPVIIVGSIKGFPPNTKHGFHVHAYGDGRKGCTSTGAHFNPDNVTHAGPTDLSRHVGDLGNIDADGDGIAHVNIKDTVISLSGRNSVIGRAFVVHTGIDDLGKGGNAESLITGNAGGRVGCGIIALLPTPSKT